jgi:apolipoprotein N-acyltransferase
MDKSDQAAWLTGLFVMAMLLPWIYVYIPKLFQLIAVAGLFLLALLVTSAVLVLIRSVISDLLD